MTNIWLSSSLPLARVWDFHPELALFQSGVDGLSSDRLGRLALTREGLARRDRMVLEGASNANVPLAITLGGGYSEPLLSKLADRANWASWK